VNRKAAAARCGLFIICSISTGGTNPRQLLGIAYANLLSDYNILVQYLGFARK
jgi:hypothetical protein